MSLNPLWAKDNTTLFSGIFNVPPGQVCILTAANLEQWKYRDTAASIRVPQAVCVRRVMYDFSRDGVERDACGFVFNIKGVVAEKIVDMPVQTCGAPWSLTMCRNIGIVGVPGSYRLELNDATVIGVVQVYAELFEAKSIPPQVQNLFFL